MSFEQLRQQQQRAREEQAARDKIRHDQWVAEDQRRQEIKRQTELADASLSGNASRWFDESGIDALLREYASLQPNISYIRPQDPPVTETISYVYTIPPKWFLGKPQKVNAGIQIKRCAQLSVYSDQVHIGFSANGCLVVAGDSETGVTILDEHVWRNTPLAIENAIELAHHHPMPIPQGNRYAERSDPGVY